MIDNRTAEVYRCFDETGSLLYVGSAFSAASRAQQHRSKTAWWHEVARTDVERFESKEAAQAAETRAISTERPKYNVVHNGWKCSAEKQAEILGRLARSAAALAFDNRGKVFSDAYAEGNSYREIAAVAGMSHAGVRKIINAYREKNP